MRILILGATGMLGSAVLISLQKNENFDVWATLRNTKSNFFYNQSKLIHNIDVLDQDSLIGVFEKIKPNLVINCIGLIKQLAHAKDPLCVLPINSIFPHRLAKLCSLSNARLIHFSTDCVFSGKKGNYTESDSSDADDLYGKSKFIGEVTDLSHVLTLRTSIIGHEINTNYALINWFLSQNQTVKGFVKAIYTGLPTFELARVIQNYVIPNPNLSGLYHVATKPINKHDLLNLVAETYGKKITIIPDDQVKIDRSLNAVRFNKETGYIPPEWPKLIEVMHQSQKLYRG
ncbi:TPA: sugar nucleotide-binding protein [Legionella pneumophila subsp. pneumophila]|uniref:dTDP-4-dehydrorhamnose reductase n=1 Tax=Legionella taurinensis TaxID=70611 RepID=A0A3A5L1K7_9GAMM|nr:SDR family oxidoreductase [Legionella taurinensis]RJT44415.1 SDR family oxidoreductase [Legionella taurinensis]HAT9713039.1 sugar nucleotide-binding protein [Legionella pneumophila subsp. pneumophila]